MTTERKLKSIDKDKEISECPSCGYKDGFHIGFLSPENSNTHEMFLICPNCHDRFKIGWGIKLDE